MIRRLLVSVAAILLIGFLGVMMGEIAGPEDVQAAETQEEPVQMANDDAGASLSTRLDIDHYLLLNQPGPLWLRGIDLAGADLRRIDLRMANLASARLHGVDLRDALLVNAFLDDIDLSEADLRNAVLTGASLRRADLTHAALTFAGLEHADLSAARLAGAALHGANLGGAQLADAELTGARYDADTIWPQDFDPQAAGALLEAAPE